MFSPARISVLMTCFNSANTISESIASVLDQSYSNWQLIIVDNCSTDETVSIIKTFKDERINLTSLEQNLGRTAALNLGISLCSGEYIAILDADDISRKDRLEIQVSKLDLCPDVICVASWFRNISSSGQIISEVCPRVDHLEILRGLACDNPISHSTAMYRSKPIKQLGGYPKEFVYSQDFALWLEITKIGKIELIPDFLGSIRRSPTSLSAHNNMRFHLVSEGYYLYKKAQKLPGLTARDRIRGARTVGLYGLNFAWRLLLKRKILRALKIGFINSWAMPIALATVLRKKVCL